MGLGDLLDEPVGAEQGPERWSAWPEAGRPTRDGVDRSDGLATGGQAMATKTDWVLDGIFLFGAPITIYDLLITREWGDQITYHLLEMAIDEDPYLWTRLWEKIHGKNRYEKLYLFEWREPGDTNVIRPKSLTLWDPWMYSLVKFTRTHQGPVLGIAVPKNAPNDAAIDVLRGKGYDRHQFGL
jgi:hypothetical protein